MTSITTADSNCAVRPCNTGSGMLPAMLQAPDDQALMLRYRDGDAQAFETLYARHKGALYRYLLRQCRHAANAEEIFQEVWFRVIRARERYEPRAKFTTWLFQIARNCFIDHVRRQGRSAIDQRAAAHPDELAAGTGNPEQAAALSQSGQQLARAIAALPEDQREVFLLRAEGGFALKEIAEITATGHETVKSRLRYAMSKLRTALEEPGHE